MNNTSDDKLDAALTRLPRNIEPQHDLWPGISARIKPRRQSWSHDIWSRAGAVAAVVVVAVSVIWVAVGNRMPASDDALFTATVPATHVSSGNDPRMVFTAQLASDHDLPPKARHALLDNLRLLNDSIRRTRAALKKYPDDVNLQALLFNLYEQEAQLMNEAQQAQIQTTVRNML